MHSFRSCCIVLSACIAFNITFSQINPDSVTIVRDQWGVPHVYGPTDASVAYGLAWAQAEDDFYTMQEGFLASKGLLGEVKGKKGAIMDVVAFLVGVDELVDSAYDSSISPEFKKVLSGYVQGMNEYALKHPNEVLHQDLFPVCEKDIVKNYAISMTFMTKVHYELNKIFKNKISEYEMNLPTGSNAFAISGDRTDDGKTFLAINSHQPLEGSYSWYEAHVHSDEGWNILGGTFAGGVTMFSGANENLGWAHTLNYHDFCDVYKLYMNPKNKNQYFFDGKWHELEKRKFKFKVKIAGGIKVPITKTFYQSKYGPTIKNKTGYYSLRFPARFELKAPEQWYWMNKATNFEEFYEALKIQGLAGTNIVYADKESNIFYISNGLFPDRNPDYNWAYVLPGHTSETLWKPDFFPLDSLPMIKNPYCGYVYNMNNTPFSATAPGENLSPENFNPTIGLQTEDNNRSLRFQFLISQYDTITYENFKDIKYDNSFSEPVYSDIFVNIDQLFEIDTVKYPKLSGTMQLLSTWDGTASVDNQAATTIVLALNYLLEHFIDEGVFDQSTPLLVEKDVMYHALDYARKHLKKHFGTIHVALGELQKHIRGDVELPIGGAPDVLTAMYTVPYKNGKYKAYVGECYIQLVKFSEEGVEIESVNAFGSSNRPESPHYTDQMELFVNNKTKIMTLDKAEVLKSAEKVYHPK